MSQNYMHIYTQGKKRGRPKKVKSEEEDTDEDDAEEMEREKAGLPDVLISADLKYGVGTAF